MVRNTLQIADDIQEDHTVGGLAELLGQTLDVLFTKLLFHIINHIFVFYYFLRIRDIGMFSG